MTTSDTRRGLYSKYRVDRLDGKERGPYFVLDYGHDPHAAAALLAYANSCESGFPDLARDLRAIEIPDSPGGEDVTKAHSLFKILKRIEDSHEEWKRRYGPKLVITVGRGNALGELGVEYVHGIRIDHSYDVSIMHEDGSLTPVEGSRFTVNVDTEYDPDDYDSEDSFW